MEMEKDYVSGALDDEQNEVALKALATVLSGSVDFEGSFSIALNVVIQLLEAREDIKKIEAGMGDYLIKIEKTPSKADQLRQECGKKEAAKNTKH